MSMFIGNNLKRSKGEKKQIKGNPGSFNNDQPKKSPSKMNKYELVTLAKGLGLSLDPKMERKVMLKAIKDQQKKLKKEGRNG